jgi:hypothetical protein
MVRGLNSFKDWFRGYESVYAVIGGTACDLLMSEVGGQFRATKDIDMVLIVEALTPDFGSRLWEYIKNAGYEHRRKSTDTPEFYRFTNPISPEYPHMIELFSRRIEGIVLPPDAVFTPLPIDRDVSSLSAILLDDNYYEFLKSGTKVIEGISVIDAARMIPFKAKAWLDLEARKTKGEQIDSKNIRKHKNDVLLLYDLLPSDLRIVLPETIEKDMKEFIWKNIDGNETRLLHIAKIYGIDEKIPTLQMKKEQRKTGNKAPF